MTDIRFGTDGWRAIIAEDFTFANVRRCALAVAEHLRDTGLAERGLVIGFDTRFASDRFAAAAAEVATALDIPVYLAAAPTPTPVVSYSILNQRAGGGIVITASHNAPEYNGFKYKPAYAGSASPEIVSELEERIAQHGDGPVPRLPLNEGVRQGLLHRFDPSPPYLSHLATLVDLERLRSAGLAVAIDSMYGAGIGYLRQLLGGGRMTLTELHAERNPNFPGFAQPEPIAPNLNALAQVIQEEGMAVGLATDGDADRLGVMDERGGFVTQLQTFALLVYYLLEVRGERGAVVRSITTTSMADRLGERYNVPVYETAVGFKYIGPLMLQHEALVGGEESGGYGFRGHIPERDGILAGLYFLDLMVRTGRTPSQLIADLYALVGPHHYDRLDVRFDAEERGAILQRLEASRPEELDGAPVEGVDTIDGVRYRLADGSWLLLRFSGTEPLLRIYTETNSEARCQRLLSEGRTLAGV